MPNLTPKLRSMIDLTSLLGAWHHELFNYGTGSGP